MIISRRNFLKVSAALALQACAPMPLRKISRGSAEGEALFYVPSPKNYLNIDQDFSAVSFAHRVTAGLKDLPASEVTHLTVLNDRGTMKKAIAVPGLVHSVHVDQGVIYLLTADFPAFLYALDASTYDVLAMVRPAEGEFTFGGHSLSVPGSNHVAVTMNSGVIGKYDRVSIREKRTLKEVAGFSSYGFEAHDIKISPDGKQIYVGHYGSLLGTGPYDKMRQKSYQSTGKDLMAKRKSNFDPNNKYLNIYPGSVTVIETASGKLLDRQSSVDGGAHCHMVVDSGGRVYLPHQPSLVQNRADSMTNRLFQEGEHGPDQVESFVPKMQRGFGTGIAYDPKFKQVIIPARWTEELNYFSEATPGEFVNVNLKPSLPEMHLTHGIAFHPDGEHYVVTGNNWFATIERGTHRVVPERSFQANLFLHAHTAAG